MLKDAFNSEAYNDRFLTLLDTTTLFIVTMHNFQQVNLFMTSEMLMNEGHNQTG